MPRLGLSSPEMRGQRVDPMRSELVDGIKGLHFEYRKWRVATGQAVPYDHSPLELAWAGDSTALEMRPDWAEAFQTCRDRVRARFDPHRGRLQVWAGPGQSILGINTRPPDEVIRIRGGARGDPHRRPSPDRRATRIASVGQRRRGRPTPEAAAVWAATRTERDVQVRIEEHVLAELDVDL